MKRGNRDSVRRGAAMVEMAIVLILLMMIVLGTIEYGWLFLTMQRMTNAARQGARVEAAFGATETEGDDAMLPLLGSLPTTKADVLPSANNTVTATVIVPTDGDGVRLVNWDMLPVPPTLQVTVTMAKETVD